MNSDLTQARLKELLRYDPDTGVFVWKAKRRGVRHESVAGCMCSLGYWQIMVDRKMYKAHRLAWLYMVGAWPADQIDHVNREKSDNRFVNLREAVNGENKQNSRIAKNNTSGVKGVSWFARDKKWMARIRVDGQKIFLGCFDRLTDAKQAVSDARERLHGEFHCHG